MFISWVIFYQWGISYESYWTLAILCLFVFSKILMHMTIVLKRVPYEDVQKQWEDYWGDIGEKGEKKPGYNQFVLLKMRGSKGYFWAFSPKMGNAVVSRYLLFLVFESLGLGVVANSVL